MGFLHLRKGGAFWDDRPDVIVRFLRLPREEAGGSGPRLSDTLRRSRCRFGEGLSDEGLRALSEQLRDTSRV